MPFTRIDIRAGRPASYRQALAQSVQRALTESFNVPADDYFMVVNEHDDGNFIHTPHYLGITHGRDTVLIQLTVRNTRTVEQKQALFARLVECLAEQPGVPREEVIVSLVENGREDWSFGNGIAQYVER